MKTMKMVLCGLAVRGLASATICHAIDTVATDVIVETEVLKGASNAAKYAVKGATLGVGMITGGLVVDKLIDGACGNEKSHKRHGKRHGKKHHGHNERQYHKGDTKKKKLEVKGLPKKKEVKIDDEIFVVEEDAPA